MMMALDTFIFETDSLPYQEMALQASWRYARSERFQALPSAQYLGEDAMDITLTGALFNGQIGNYGALATLSQMAGRGEAYQLMSGEGNVLGYFTIEALDVRNSLFFIDGVPRKADFSIKLKQAPNSDE